mmetsp:Transcript_2025/g.5700  ORF Transcript_2025/g.5700 Transcript_2025/m.5700 type:complete len:284 (-) Transcript_2025:143-994(-)
MVRAQLNSRNLMRCCAGKLTLPLRNAQSDWLPHAVLRTLSLIRGCSRSQQSLCMHACPLSPRCRGSSPLSGVPHTRDARILIRRHSWQTVAWQMAPSYRTSGHRAAVELLRRVSAASHEKTTGLSRTTQACPNLSQRVCPCHRHCRHYWPARSRAIVTRRYLRRAFAPSRSRCSRRPSYQPTHGTGQQSRVFQIWTTWLSCGLHPASARRGAISPTRHRCTCHHSSPPSNLRGSRPSCIPMSGLSAAARGVSGKGEWHVAGIVEYQGNRPNLTSLQLDLLVVV